MQMKNTLLIVLSSFLFIFCRNTKSQTIYGVNGIIKIPNAYVVDTGKCSMGAAYLRDYHGKTDELINQYIVSFNFGVLTRLEIGIRLATMPGLPTDSKIFNAAFDRIFNAKYALIDEKIFMPQIAVGMQDIVGTRLYNSTYLVASKSLQIKKSFSCLLNLGYGTKFNDLILGDASNHYFIGFFGGTVIGFKKSIFFMAEYDAKDINAGLKIAANKWFSFNFSLLNLKIPSAGLALKFTL